MVLFCVSWFAMSRLFKIYRVKIITDYFSVKNQFCSKPGTEPIRTRFAPSPTGDLHLGSLRTALFNYLFAKSKNGKFILRIEDTDQKRKIEGSVDKIIADLKWCGINIDEGPYYQSTRVQIYKTYAKQLIDAGDAYYCFCNESRLNLIRKAALKTGEIPKYDNHCRHLVKEEIEQKLMDNVDFTIRFKLSRDTTSFEDIIYGKFNYDIISNEGDPVILKSDGYPTYHFANIIDDHLMKITHVLRGVEWMTSTIKHLQLYKAFKWRPPIYGHLPLLMNSDGTKLSKRQSSISISHFREEGIFPNALVNLVTRAGGGFNIEYSERDSKTFTMEEFIKLFDISKVNTNSCKFPGDWIDKTNRLEMKRLLQTDDGAKLIVEKIQDLVKNYFTIRHLEVKLITDKDYVMKALDILVDRIYKLEDVVSDEFIFIWFMPDVKFQDFNIKRKYMEEITDYLNEVEWDNDSLTACFKDFTKRKNIKYNEFMQNLRLILTGKKQGPGVNEILLLLGKERSLDRMRMSLSM